MAKLTRFAVSPHGELVYASTGRLAKAGYTLKERKGRTTEVYNGTKLVGRIYKRPTKAEKQRITKADANRAKKRLKSTLETPFDSVSSDGTYSESATNPYALETAKDWRKFRDWYDYNIPFQGDNKGASAYPMNRWERSLANYAKALEKAVSTGKLTEVEARAKWDAFSADFSDESVAKEAWGELHQLSDEVDFVY